MKTTPFKFWTYPAQLRDLQVRLANSDACLENANDRRNKLSTLNSQLSTRLSLSRRALSRYRKQDGMTDEEIAAAFESLLENKGFEAILALLTEAEMQAMDRMTEDGRAVLDMKKDAGAIDALTNLHARLIDLEDQAKRTAQRKANKAA